MNLNPFGLLKYLAIAIPVGIFCFGMAPLIGMILFLIQTRTFTWRVKFLYLWTLFLEIPGVVIRFFLSLLFLPAVVSPFLIVIAVPVQIGIVVTVLTGKSTWAVANVVGYGYWVAIAIPTIIIVGIVWTFFASWGSLVVSFLDFLGWPTSLWITRLSLGAYKPSQRQREWYDQACDRIKARAITPAFTFPVNIYMLERTDNTIFTIANTMFISQALMRGENFATLLAGELYWYNSGASRVVKSLRSLSIDVMYLLSRAVGVLAPGNIAASLAGGEAVDRYLANVFTWLLNFALAIAGGGVGVFLLLPFWQLYSRSETYKADAYAADLGFCIELKNYLDQQTRVPIMLPIPYFMSPEPFTELRHDKLNQRCSGASMPAIPAKESTTQPLQSQP